MKLLLTLAVLLISAVSLGSPAAVRRVSSKPAVVADGGAPIPLCDPYSNPNCTYDSMQTR